MQKKLLTKLANARLRSILETKREFAAAVLAESVDLTVEAQQMLYNIERDFERAEEAIKKYWPLEEGRDEDGFFIRAGPELGP